MNTLTQRHRAQQLLLRKATVAQVSKLWPALDWNRLDATYPAFAVQVARLVQTNRQTSSGLAAAYLRAFRRASDVPGDVKAVFAAPLVVDQFQASLHTTSVAAVKNAAGSGADELAAMADARTQTVGAMARLVLNGGRETLLGSLAVTSRRRPLGYSSELSRAVNGLTAGSHCSCQRLRPTVAPAHVR